eukprot:3207731-Prymnesium_polylepis.1
MPHCAVVVARAVPHLHAVQFEEELDDLGYVDGAAVCEEDARYSEVAYGEQHHCLADVLRGRWLTSDIGVDRLAEDAREARGLNLGPVGPLVTGVDDVSGGHVEG